VRPARCVAIEDSASGLRAASAAGITVIAVPNPHFAPDDDALSLAAATVTVVGDVTPELVQRVGAPTAT
jgi:beta-phosphoglucomutase-like phosphatase (HAD superfamily)